MALRIGFDLDGVLADMDAELRKQAEALFGEVPTRPTSPSSDPEVAAGGTEPGDDVASGTGGAPSSRMLLSPRQQRRLWTHVQSIENFWETLAEIEPGIVERLGALAVEKRWEVIFLTKRPHSAGATAQVQTQRWLATRGFALPSVFVVQGSRGRIAAALDLDVVVDDRPENTLDIVMDSSARAILIWRDDEKNLPAASRRLGIGVVRSVAECLDVLAQSDSPAPEEGGLVARVMKALGFRQPAGA